MDCLLRCKTADGYLVVLGGDWRLDGSQVVEAKTLDELEYKLAAARCDGRWVTVNGSHIYINGRGFVTLGGGRLKGHRLANGHKKRELVAKYNRQRAGRVAKKMILKAHDGIFSKEQAAEFNAIIARMPPEEAVFYNAFVQSKLKRNSYSSKLDAQYSDTYDRVFMNINNTTYEEVAGMSHKGAYKTKFHEEFHQLDAALSKKRFFGLGKSQMLTDTSRDTGKRMSDAIEKDLVRFINKAIDQNNLTADAADVLKHIKSTSEVSYGERGAVLRMLYKSDAKKLAHMEMLTDALVMHTSGKINVLAVPDAWGHEREYAQQYGKNGATAETWATFGAYKYTYTKEMQDTIKELMPETIKTYSEIYKDVVKQVNREGFGG